MKNKIEILCPAGDFTSVIAAVSNGGNAIYLGQKNFSARQNAKNFDEKELAKTVSYCHARNVLVYAAINTLINDSQINELEKSIKTACECGVDALIIQDLAVLSITKKICPQMPLHASTQMAVHTACGAKFLKKQGFSRVVLARELSFAEIKDIVTSVDIETEVFVHGALCMSVSGQCYMSAMIGTRSGNRGNCAGTCRLPFSANNSKDTYALSLKDMCLATHINKLKEIGVTSAKIEGRMKRPEYVAITAKLYDDAVSGITPDIETAKSVFSRSGFTDGYFVGNINSDMFGHRQKDDVLSATNKILKEIENTYKKEKQLVPINFSFSAIKNPVMSMSLSVTDLKGNSIFIEGNAPEIAQNKATTEEDVKKSLLKLGGTPFYLDKFDCNIADGLYIKASDINEMRRNACEKMLDILSEITPIECGPLSLEIKSAPTPKQAFLYRARFNKVNQIPFEKITELEFITLPVDEIINNLDLLEQYKDKVIIEPYRIMFGSEKDLIERLNSLYERGYRHLLVQNIAHLEYSIGFTLHIGAYMNCFNSISANMLYTYGASDIALSFELDVKKINEIKSPVPTGILAYGKLPLMIMRNCPIKAEVGCKNCTKKLTDRMNIDFPVLCHNKKYVEILNSNRLFLADRIKEFNSISFAELYFTDENKNECLDIMDMYQNSFSPEKDFTRGLYYRTLN